MTILLRFEFEDHFCHSFNNDNVCNILYQHTHTHTHTRTHVRKHTNTHTLNGLFSGTTQVSRYQKGKNILDFTEASDSEWKWHQLGMQVCTSLQHPTTQSFLQAGSPSCRPTNSVKALKAFYIKYTCILQSPLPVGVSSIRKHTKLQN